MDFIRRQSNGVAHELAKAFTSSTSFGIFDGIPTCITDLIFNEMIQVIFPQQQKKNQSIITACLLIDQKQTMRLILDFSSDGTQKRQIHVQMPNHCRK